MSVVADTSTSAATEVVCVRGGPLEIPADLYVPPDALSVVLETFTGPLDLLLYLIKHQSLDILDLPIAEIARQYLAYIELMTALRLNLAAEYLAMAAMLAEIKSRLLLPRPVTVEAEEQDPRAELVKRLQEYAAIKQAAEALDGLPRIDRDIFMARVAGPEVSRAAPIPEVTLESLLSALGEVLRRAELAAHHQVSREPLSVRSRMTEVLSRLEGRGIIPFHGLFSGAEGRAGVIVALLAILELVRERAAEFIQPEPFAPIHIKAVG